MTKYVINLLQVPNQEVSCNLEKSDGSFMAVDIRLRTLPDNMLIADITINNEVQRLSAAVHNNMPLIPTNIVGGNIYFTDIHGDTDPQYGEFNERYQLIYDSEYQLY